jgi:hypothetical protein
MVGITKLEGVTLEELKRPRREITPKVVEEIIATQEPQSGTTTTTPTQP